MRALNGLVLDSAVTFFVGENGSGKSTIAEAIAVAIGLNPDGGTRNFNFATRASHSPLAGHLRLVRNPVRIRDAFSLRAESLYNVSTEIERLDQDTGLGGFVAARVIDSYGGVPLHDLSHGESFFAALLNRLGGDGFYVFDEPEAALSPIRQLACVARMHQLVQARSQFVVATHSPILMGYPGATTYLLSEAGIRCVAYEETEHYQVTRDFLVRREEMLAELLTE